MAAGNREFGPHSAGSYFELLLERAIEAESRGNYAISAALSLRHSGTELIAVGTNTVFKSRDPSGHAEMNAIRLAHSIGLAGRDEAGFDFDRARRDVVVREAADDRTEAVLYTTLEPCPMCTVAIINAGIDRVVVAAEDPQAGSLSRQRLESLPPLWAQLADSIGLRVCFSQSEDPQDSGTYLEPELRHELIDVFLRSRDPLDSALAAGGVLDIAAIHAGALHAHGAIG